MNWLLVAAILVSVSGGGGGLVVAADAAAPGDALYSLDLALEDLRLENTTDSTQAVKLQMAFAQERLKEAHKLAARGDEANYDQALSGYDDTMSEVAQSLLSAGASDPAQLEQVMERGFAAQDTLFNQMDADDDDPDDESPADSKWCAGEGQHPVALRLAERYEVAYEEIIAWFCDGAGFGEISLAYGISQEAEVPVEELFGMRAEGLGWGEIKQAFGLNGGPGDGDDDGDEAEDPADGNFCAGDGEGQHPQGARLADRYEVGYAEIMDWFCQGYGFGEISAAYEISQQAGVSVSELFDMVAAGMGWGEIKQEYGLNGKPEDAGPPEGVPTGPGNNNGNGPPEDVPSGPGNNNGNGNGPPEDVPTGPGNNNGNGPPDVPPGQVGKDKPPKP